MDVQKHLDMRNTVYVSTISHKTSHLGTSKVTKLFVQQVKKKQRKENLGLMKIKFHDSKFLQGSHGC